MIARADTQVLGEGGLVHDLRNTAAQLHAMLGDARATLGSIGTLLQEAQTVAKNARIATTDLGVLRAEVEAALRKLDHLLDEINRKWPFARDTELKLP